MGHKKCADRKPGVNTEIFLTNARRFCTRDSLGPAKFALLGAGYGKKIPKRFSRVSNRCPATARAFSLLVIGDGAQGAMSRLRRTPVALLPFSIADWRSCRFYRAADLSNLYPETFILSRPSQACGTPVVGIHGSYMDWSFSRTGIVGA